MVKYITLTLVASILCAQSRAQTFTVIYSFTDGSSPCAGVVLHNGTFYGTSYAGGAYGWGAIFKVNKDGSDYTVIKSFSPLVDYYSISTNADGARPLAGLTISGDTIYGAASAGGSSGDGTLFRIDTDGTNFTVLKDFTNNAQGVALQGAAPASRLILRGNVLYGTVPGVYGGLFRINTNGTGFAMIKNIAPEGDLILQNDTFYGINAQSIFSMKTNGMDYTVIRTFTNSPDGYVPQTGLVLDGNTLYGTTSGGGTNDSGTIFKVNTDGSGYRILRNLSFDSDGEQPTSSLILISNTLYGATYMGGPLAFGTVFKINTDGSGFAVVKAFSDSGGAFPMGNLMLDGNTLYGTTASGGINGGVVYSLDLTPITASISSLNSLWELNWNAVSNHVYQLQFTTNLAQPDWQDLGSSITATNGSISTFLTPGTGAQRFYRIYLVQ